MWPLSQTVGLLEGAQADLHGLWDTYQAQENTEELHHICVSNGIQAAKQCVSNSNDGRYDDGRGVINLYDHGQRGTWTAPTITAVLIEMKGSNYSLKICTS